MSKKTEETGTTTTEQTTSELALARESAVTQFDIQSAIAVALRYPRDEIQAIERLHDIITTRPAFAEDSYYAYPRGESMVIGPSVWLAREIARLWKNLWSRVSVIGDDDYTRRIHAMAWDLESNRRIEAEDQFSKLIPRKIKGGDDSKKPQLRWIKPDERELRELTNRHAAILERNCILQLLPRDVIDECVQLAVLTVKKASRKVASPGESANERLIKAFATLKVTPEMLESHLKKPLSEITEGELAELRGVYKAIVDGETTWAKYSAQEDSAGNNNGETKQTEPEVGSPPVTALQWGKLRAIRDARGLTRENVIALTTQFGLICGDDLSRVPANLFEKIAAEFERWVT